MSAKIHHGDAVRWATEYSGPLFHALLCDAPYEMGFMGKAWDDSGVAFDRGTWQAFANVLHPGAFLFVSAGTINDDLISVAMREAGLRKFHKMMGWAYGSGFPKASRIDTQVDNLGGLPVGTNEICDAIVESRKKRGLTIRECDNKFCGGTTNWSWYEGRPKGRRIPDSKTFKKIAEEWPELFQYYEAIKRIEREVLGKSPDSANRRSSVFSGINPDGREEGERIITSPATSLAQAWEGHRYGLQALKPAIETILIFQKPYEGKPIDNITETGAGALNIEGGRIETEEIPSNQWSDNAHPFGGGAGNEYKTVYNSGRWPSNFLLLDEAAALALDEQSGELNSGGAGKRFGELKTNIYGGGKGINYKEKTAPYYGGVGGASRFFFHVSEQIDEADPVFYSAKASRGEREAGLGENKLKESAQRYGLTGSLEETGHGPHKHHKAYNPHPTVKPLSLCKYLASLLLPPPEYSPRRLFVPFAGVASEMIGAIQAGWDEIEGVELTEEYIPIAEARLAYWQKKPAGSRKPKSSIPLNVKDPNQPELL